MKTKNARYGWKDAAGQTQQPPGNTAPTTQTPTVDVTVADLSKLIADGVKAAFAAFAPPQPPVTPPAPPAQGLKAEDVKGMIDAAVSGAMAQLKPGIKDGSEATQRGQIEIPIGERKGNLPVHRKQLLNILMKRHENDGIDSKDLSRAAQAGEELADRRLSYKLLTSTGSGTGDELVPTDLAGEIQRRMYLASNLYAFMAAQEINMTSNPMAIPFSTTRPTYYGESVEGTARVESTPGTAGPTITAVTYSSLVPFSYELAEDSIVPLLPHLQGLLATAAADAMEDVLLNGDTTATHMDSDTNAVSKAAPKYAKGLRKYALAGSLTVDAATGGLSLTNIKAALKLLGKWGVQTTDVAFVVGAKGINDIRGMSDLITVDKAGGRATLFNGAVVDTLFGSPVIISGRCREDLNASGVYDGTTTTKGSFVMFNRNAFWMGRRREFTVEIERSPTSQKTNVVASFRRGFSPSETPSASISTVVLGYNYAA